jgi:hypothetical protein
MKYTYALFFILLGVLLVACGTQNDNIPVSTWTPIPNHGIDQASATPDPCALENLEASIKPINDLMREFDDASRLASNLTKDQVPPMISEMQRIRRNAEDQNVPDCLETLKEHQLAHMNSVIDTMLGFVSGADANALNPNIVNARKEHDLYTLEMAHLLGISPTTTP